MKMLKVRFLLPLLGLAYVGLGVFVVPWIDRTSGHAILVALAIATLLLVWYWFYRYDLYYKEPGEYLSVFRVTLAIAVGLAALVVYHMVVMAMGTPGVFELFAGEGALLLLAIAVTLIYFNSKPHTP